MPNTQDTFLTGELNAPDLQTTAALNKIALGMPISNQEMMRITTRQKIEQQMLKTAGGWGITDPDVLARVIGQGGSSMQSQTPAQSIADKKGIDVRSYVGSMWSGAPIAPIPQGAPKVGEPGGGIDVRSYVGSMFGQGGITAMPELSTGPNYNKEAGADRILRERFGSFVPGQIQTAPAPAQHAPPIAMPIVTSDGETYTPQPIVRQPSYSAPATGYAPQTQPYQPPQPSKPSILGGTPVQQSSPSFSWSSAPLLGQQTQQNMPLDSFARAAAMSPHGQALQMQQRQLQMAEDSRRIAEQNRQIEQAAYAVAGGEDVSKMGIPPQLLGQVNIKAREIQNQATPQVHLYEEMSNDPQTGEIIVTQKDTRTGKVVSQYRKHDPLNVGSIAPGTAIVRTPGGFESRPIPGAPKSEFQIAQEEKAQARSGASDIIRNSVADVLALNEAGAMVNPNNNFLKNLEAKIGSSTIGQALSGAAGTQVQGIRDRLSQASANLIPALAAATGIKSTQLNSNKELEFYLQTMADPKKDFLTNLSALDALNKKINPNGADVVSEMLADQPQVLAKIRRQSNIMSRNHPLDLSQGEQGSNKVATPNNKQKEVPVNY